jgi:MFS family permease
VRPPAFFAALRHRNFRLFLIGQFVSLCGTWIQTIASGWLVLHLTNSAFQVGLVTTLGTLPILLFTLYGGVVADRVNKHRLVLILQCLMVCEALTLGTLIVLDRITVHWVMGLAVFYGTLAAFEVPTRQSLIAEIVDREDLMNAIALGSSAFNAARVVGPAIAGVLIATLGLAACFFANAASYLAVIYGLLVMRVDRRPRVEHRSALEAMREGFAYVFGNRWPRAVVVIIATFAVFGFSFIPMMPVFARDALHLGADGYGALMSAVGVGAAAAALFMAGLGGRGQRAKLVLGSSMLFALAITGAALAPSFWSAVVLFTLAGSLMALAGIAANTTLQTQAPDHLRGRVMGFYSFVVLGMAPFGSLQAGWVAEHFGVRTAIASGGVVCLLVSWVVAWRLADRREGGRTGGRLAGRTGGQASGRAGEPADGQTGGQPRGRAGEPADGPTVRRLAGWWRRRAEQGAVREATMELPALEAVAEEASFASGGAAAAARPSTDAPDGDEAADRPTV